MEHSLLIIDDSKTIRSQIEQIFAAGELFKTILVAENGLEGFKLVVNHDVDMILCDIEMPGIDGLKFLAMLQSREDLRGKPVIMLTSHDDLDTKIRVFESGACDYITKPFHAEEVAARVRVHMQIKILQDELRRSNQLLQEQAQTDPLTGLCNRRHLYQILSSELNRCCRNQQPIAMIMIDIDHFKQINDSYGHQAGDAVLVGIADLLQNQLRTYDRVARYGGEEFCLVLPETDLEEAGIVAERLRQMVEKTVFEPKQQNCKLTISLGVSAYRGCDEGSLEELINIADSALYAAKEAGRNRSVCREITLKKTRQRVSTDSIHS